MAAVTSMSCYARAVSCCGYVSREEEAQRVAVHLRRQLLPVLDAALPCDHLQNLQVQTAVVGNGRECH